MVKRKLTVCETLFVRSWGRWVRERLHTCASLCCYVLVSLHNAAAVAGVVFLVVVVRVGIYLHVRVNECVVPAAWDRERARDLFFLKSLVRLKKKKKKRNFSSVQSNAISSVVGAGHSRRREKLSVRLKLSSLAKNIHTYFSLPNPKSEQTLWYFCAIDIPWGLNLLLKVNLFTTHILPISASVSKRVWKETTKSEWVRWQPKCENI